MKVVNIIFLLIILPLAVFSQTDLSTNATVSVKEYPSREQKMWALGACALLTERNKGNHEILGFVEKNDINAERERKTLKEWWGVKNANDLKDSLVWLELDGHRAEFDDIYTNISIMSTQQLINVKLKLLNDKKALNRIKVVEKNGPKLGTKSILAWDYDRYIALCGWGYVAGYLTEKEAWSKIMPAAIKLQRTFSSWEELGENHLIGRSFWSLKHVKEESKEYDQIYKKLCTDPESPWKKNAWGIDLAPSPTNMSSSGRSP